jgi:drug/metabolite transporter (DMT)-like permease
MMLPVLYLLGDAQQLSHVGERLTEMPVWGIWGLFVLVSFITQMCRNRAYAKVKNPSTLSPFIYLGVLVAGVLEWLVHGRLPTSLTIVGAVLIMFSSLYMIIYRIRKGQLDAVSTKNTVAYRKVTLPH